MGELKVIIVPSETETRLLGRDGNFATKLRATLPSEPAHPQALPMLLKALGCFHRVHAALVVPSEAPSSATRLYPGWFGDIGGGLYELQVIGGSRRERREWWGR